MPLAQRALFVLIGVVSLLGPLAPAAADPPPVDRATVNPADWGSDHVGQPFPDYLTGDECLFCHRKIGPTWDANPHQRTFQPATPDDPAVQALAAQDADAAQETKLLLGAQRVTRFLRRSDQYGKLDMLSTSFRPETESEPATLIDTESIEWDANVFADNCIGCHTTAVDTPSRTFSTISLDCVTCHGLVELEHTDDTSKVFLSAQSRDPKKITSVCGQCHLRGGRSKSTGLPYPNTFVVGDNLFRDFQVDWTNESIEQLPVIEQHIFINARDVVLHNKTNVTCVNCHQVHDDHTDSHQGLAETAICASCHQPNTDNSELLEAYRQQAQQRPTNKTCAY